MNPRSENTDVFATQPLRAAAIRRLRRVYLVTPDWDDTSRLLAYVQTALSAGVSSVQYRHKTADSRVHLAQAQALRALARASGALLIVNDDLDLAIAVAADGLHLGKDDGDAVAVRAQLPPPMLLGVSCYDDMRRAQDAHAAGADYVAFGSVFPSTTKPGAACAPLSLLTRGAQSGLHTVAIGGIDAANIGPVAGAGAHAAAVSQAVFGAADEDAAGRVARILLDQFDLWTPHHGPQSTTV